MAHVVVKPIEAAIMGSDKINYQPKPLDLYRADA